MFLQVSWSIIICFLIPVFIFVEIDLNPYLTTKSKDCKIHDIFIDPTGKHCLITTSCLPEPSQSGSPTHDAIPVPNENFYYNKKLYQLTKLKGFIISSVGWNNQTSTQSSPNTGNILVGTNDGKIWETQLQPDDKLLTSKEIFVRQVYDLVSVLANNPNQASLSGNESCCICAINWFSVTGPSEQYCVLVATNNILYQFVGYAHCPSQEGTAYLYQLFTSPINQYHKEMPGHLKYSKLDFYCPNDSLTPKSFGWLTGTQ